MGSTVSHLSNNTSLLRHGVKLPEGVVLTCPLPSFRVVAGSTATLESSPVPHVPLKLAFLGQLCCHVGWHLSTPNGQTPQQLSTLKTTPSALLSACPSPPLRSHPAALNLNSIRAPRLGPGLLLCSTQSLFSLSSTCLRTHPKDTCPPAPLLGAPAPCAQHPS